MTDLAPGRTVSGRYELVREVGRGGMGSVWAATQTVTRKPVALKFLFAHKAQDPETRRRFLREARAVAAVRHPGVVQIFDVFELDDGSPVMVMELLRGESLESRLAREKRLPLGEAAAVLARVVSAVGTAHSVGVIHRDLKPENVFLAETPDGIEVKVLDFGIAKVTSEADGGQTGALTQTGALLGTPFYMSPEQVFGEKKIDHRADIWSLGIILYRMLTGVLPTEADNVGQIMKAIMTNSIRPIGELVPDLPADVVSLVTRMLSTSAAGRPSDAREVLAVLRNHAGMVGTDFDAPAPMLDQGTKTPPTTSLAQTPAADTGRGSRRDARLIALLVGSVAITVATAIGLAVHQKSTVARPTQETTISSAPLGDEPTNAGTVVPPAQSEVHEIRPVPEPTRSASPPPTASHRAAVGAPSRPNATAASATATTAPSAPPTTKPAASSMGGIVEKPNF